MGFLSNPQIQILFQLILAVLLGSLVGFEREYQKRAAGIRTHSLVCLGATLFTILATESFRMFSQSVGVSFDPSRTIAGIVLGVGFIGGGLLIRRGLKIEGLTTAAGIWVVAAIGVAVGIKLYLVAVFTALLVLGVLTVFRVLEERFFWNKEKDKN